ncbi:MAG TPA: substrate-binding domain-containing protein, partial [Candidatus Limnocylindria bacterium]
MTQRSPDRPLSRVPLAILLVLLLVGLVLGACASGKQVTPSPSTAATASTAAGAPARPTILLATTTSTQDSGLLDVLIPDFEKRTGYVIKTSAVGTGAALAIGAKGDADVVLVHAPKNEKEFMAAGNGSRRIFVMHNDFILVGPSSDPAAI